MLAVAQSTGALHTTALEGMVTDPAGASLANAEISLLGPGGKVLGKTVSDGGGHYYLKVKVEPGAFYREQAAAQGFRTAVLDQLTLSGDGTRVEDFRLQIGGASETVTITADERVGNGQIATVAQSGILGTLSASDTPYSVSSYTSELIRDQQAQSITDVLHNEVGIQETNGRYSEDNYLTLRGFVLDSGESLTNGMAGLVDHRSPSIDNIERVEIFKGPSSFVNGASGYGAVGGTINLVTKRAGNQPLFRFDGGYSSNREFEGHADVGRRFFHDGALGVRANLGGRFGDTPIDNQEEHVADASVAVDYRGEHFRASVDASEQARSLLGSRDSVYVLPGFAIPQAPKMTSNMFDHSSSYVKHQTMALVQGEYTFNTHASVFGSYGYAQSPESYVGPGLSYLNNSAGDVTVQGLPYTSSLHTNVGRIGTHLNFATGPIQHALTAAGDLLSLRAGYFYEYGDTIETNLYHPIALEGLAARVVGLKNIPDTDVNRRSSLALADVATTLHGKLIVIGGLRGQTIRVEQLGFISRSAANTPDFAACTDGCLYNKGVPSPSIAALYHVGRGFSVYGNFMQDLQQVPSAPAGSANANQVFAPAVAKQVEAGAKFEGRRSGATVAVFRIAEPNGVLNPVTNIFGITGQQRNRGLELTVFGNVLPGLRLISGLSFIDARQIGTGDPATDGKRAQGVPGRQGTLGAEWTPPRTKTLVLSARMTASSGQFVDTAETQGIPAWARLDVGMRYTFETRLPTTFRVNIDNVTGQNYFESGFLGLSYTGPRTVRVSGGIRF